LKVNLLSEEVADEVAFTTPAHNWPMVEEDTVSVPAFKVVEVALVEVENFENKREKVEVDVTRIPV